MTKIAASSFTFSGVNPLRDNTRCVSDVQCHGWSYYQVMAIDE